MDKRLINSEPKSLKADVLLLESQLLFRRLIIDPSSFDKDSFINYLTDYITKYNRINYSSLSSLIYSNEESKQWINSNLENLVNYTDKPEFDSLFDSDEQKESVKKIIVKIWDHYNLADAQMIVLSEEKFYEHFLPERDSINKSIADEGRKLNKELIAMVAIFTAMSFLIFGGLSSLSNVLSTTIEKLPVLNISISCLVWGLCVYNMIYLFMYLVGKLIDKKITSRKSEKLYKRHTVFIIGNAIILSALFVCGWIYFIKIDFKGWYTKLHTIFGMYTIVLPLFFIIFVILLILIINGVIKLTKKIKMGIIRCHYIRKYNKPVINEDDAVYDTDWNHLQDR